MPFKRDGYATLYAAVAMTALMGFVSFAVDYGRVQMARSELQDAADAAARYGVRGLKDNTAILKAKAVAIQNTVDGSSLSLLTSDIEVGSWDTSTRTFNPSGSERDAVRVTAKRTAARGNAVPLLFAKVFGREFCDITAVAVATQNQSPYSLIALNGFTMSNASRIARRSGESGSVITASNGSWSMSTLSRIAGDALYRGTGPPAVNVSGSRTLMSSDINYSVVPAPSNAYYIGNFTANSGTYNLYSGAIYRADNIVLGGSVILNVYGDIDVYVSGNFSMSGNVAINTNGTANKFTIYLTGPGSINFTNNNPMCVVVYGPNATMNVNAPGKITGSFVCKTLNFTSGNIDYSGALAIPIEPTGGGAATADTDIATVQYQ